MQLRDSDHRCTLDAATRPIRPAAANIANTLTEPSAGALGSNSCRRDWRVSSGANGPIVDVTGPRWKLFPPRKLPNC